MKPPQYAQRKAAGPSIDTPTAQSGGVTMAPPQFGLQASAGPVQKKEDPTVKKGGNEITIKSGDTLWDLSRSVYGHHRYIKDIKAANPGKNMVIGEVYKLPEISIPIGTAIEDRKGSETKLKELLLSIPAADYEAFRDGRSIEDKEKDGEFMQLVDMIRNTGMTTDEMGQEQKTFMEDQAKTEGKSVGQYIKDKVDKDGYGGGTSAQWDAFTPTEKADYTKRFQKLVKRLETESPQGIRDVIKEAKKHGGGFVWEPAEVEKNGAFAYTAGDWSLHAGVKFVDAVEKDLDAAYPNIAHEMGGHNEYGGTLGFAVFNSALGKMDAGEQKTALSGKNSTYSVFGYLETEIWAELREHEYDNDHNSTDSPFRDVEKNGKKRPADVKHQLERIKETFSPKIAEGLVRSLYRRAKEDPRISFDSFVRFGEDIKTVFKISPWS